MKRIFIFLIISLFVAINSIFPQELNLANTLFLPGSNIFNRIFLFYFPISYKYDAFYAIQDNKLNLDVIINKDNIKIEPSTPGYFETDLNIYIKNIPYQKSDRISLSVTIQCNKKFIKKNVDFVIFIKDNIMILKGSINDLLIQEITDNEYFNKRFKWTYPIIFDLRLDLTKIITK